MTAIVRVLIRQGITPTFKLSTRADQDTLLPTVYTATAISSRPGLYTFATDVDDGEYAITQLEWPNALGVVKIADGTAKVYGSFEAMDAASSASSATVIVQPIIGHVATSVPETTVPLFVGDTSQKIITCIDSVGQAVDISALSLKLVVETNDKTDVKVYTNLELTKATNTITFTPSADMVTIPRTLKFAITNTTNGAVIVYGIMPVTYVPQQG
jgi:hypothetical protein